MSSVNTLPVSRLVNVSVSLTPAAIQAQSLQNALLLGPSSVIDPVTRIRTYSSIAAVGADFGQSAPEYLAALLWFQQSPAPTQIMIGRWVKTNSSGQLLGAPLTTASQAISVWNAITSGGFSIQIDALAIQHLSGLNFSGAANLNAVASLINVQLTGGIVVWNAAYNRFEVTSNTSGTTSLVSFATAPTAGVDISTQLGLTAASSGVYQSPGLVAETALAAVNLFDLAYGQKFYGLSVLTAADADQVAIAQYNEAASNYHYLMASTVDPNSYNPNATSDLMYMLSQLALKKTACFFNSTNPYSGISALARILTTNYSGNNSVITLMYKVEPGVVPDNLTTTQMNAIEAKNGNAYVVYNNNTAIIEPGQSCAGAPYFIDTVMIMHALAIGVQSAVYNTLYSLPTKVPQTDAGMNIIIGAVETVCAQFVTNGSLASGLWLATGFGALNTNDPLPKGYYVYAAPIAQQAPTDRAKRMGMPIQVAAKLAGAIHTVSVSILVNN